MIIDYNLLICIFFEVINYFTIRLLYIIFIDIIGNISIAFINNFYNIFSIFIQIIRFIFIAI